MRRRFLISVATTDLFILGLAILTTSEVLFGNPLPWAERRLGPEVGGVIAVSFAAALAMTLLTGRMSTPGVPRPSYGRGMLIAAGSFMIVATYIVAFRPIYSRPLLGFSFALWTMGMLLQRAIRARRPWTEKLVLVTGEKELAAHLAESAHTDVLDVLDPQSPEPPGPLARDTTLALDLRAVLSESMATFVSSNGISGVTVRPLATVYEEHTGRIPLVHIAEGWEISNPLGRTSVFLFGKRIFDLIAIIATLPIWAVLAGIVALLVKLGSPGPIIFKQARVGLHGEPFTMYKFRTMRADAERDGPRFAEPGDGRIVRGGAFLRASRMDELPQLVNVLLGHMSLVGPRAEQVDFVRHFEREIPFYSYRHLVRPGITGWAQVNYGYADDLADTIEKLTYDLFYIKHMSPLVDMQILWRSVWTVVARRGAR